MPQIMLIQVFRANRNGFAQFQSWPTGFFEDNNDSSEPLKWAIHIKRIHINRGSVLLAVYRASVGPHY